jgi:hypothetical protein
MHAVLMAEILRARSEALQRRAASVRIARAAAGARHSRLRPGIRRRLDLSAVLESIARRLTRGASGERLGYRPGADRSSFGRRGAVWL